jgi:DNA-binding GntR family transcriptional regulator
MSKPDFASQSQGELAYSKLLDAILSGAFNPGDRLREVETAEHLSLSRTPVREALRRLEADGIVEHRPRIGAVIRQLGHAEIVELYEMRLVLERTAAEMAAKHAVAAETDGMDRLNTKIAASIANSTKAAALNQKFHQSLYAAARNRFLLDAARALNNALLLLGPTTLADEERIETVCRQHRCIVDAIRAGDEEAAGAAAEAHLQTSLRHRLATLRA